MPLKHAVLGDSVPVGGQEALVKEIVQLAQQRGRRNAEAQLFAAQLVQQAQGRSTWWTIWGLPDLLGKVIGLRSKQMLIGEDFSREQDTSGWHRY